MTTKSAQQRQAIYERNTTFVRQFKEAKGCQICESHFPHFVLDTIPSIAYLAGSRCKLSKLQETLQSTQIICANCRRILEWNKRKKGGDA